MTHRMSPGVNLSKWNRKMLNAYWWVSLLAFITAVAGMLYCLAVTSSFQLWDYVRHHVLLPTICLATVLLLAEASNRKNLRFNHYFLIGAGSLLAGIMVFFHADLDGVQFFFLVPIIVSVFYFEPGKLLFSFGINVLLFFGLYQLQPTLHMQMNGLEFMITLFFMLAGLIISFGIMGRGAEMQQDLIETMQEQQDLLVKSILMDKLSKTDALTELYNHKTFHEYLDKLIDQCDQNGMSLHLAVLDIDNFKTVNDTYGHWVGDLILRSVSQTIRTIVSPDDFAARYGGEEFAILFTDKTTDVAYAYSEIIRNRIEYSVHSELQGRHVTISIGLKAYVPHSGKEWLFRGADEALYTAKRSGKNQTVLHEGRQP
ncbi:GGDEF domain-containing protein [Gorillibacterium sp. sgz5001074]|uniref:GGDEF domain-containing protein n=1 Tax=Gorillibacterium sp. sgz5001074 TaxID=3446695 RepID=UPI003F67B0D5